MQDAQRRHPTRDEAIPLLRATPGAYQRAAAPAAMATWRWTILFALPTIPIFLMVLSDGVYPIEQTTSLDANTFPPAKISSSKQNLEQPTSNIPQSKFLSSLFSSDRECEAGKSTTISYGKCGESCKPLSLTRMLACNANDVQERGCRYRHCSGTDMQCTAKNYVMERSQLCANDTLSIAQARLSELQELSFEVTLTPQEHTGTTDVYFLLSASDSMRGTLAKLSIFAEEITKAFGPDVAIGLGYFRDEYYRSGAFRNAVSLRTDGAADVQTALRELHALGGGDDSEANLYAMHEVARRGEIGWRVGARHALVYIANAPGHEPSCLPGMTLTRESVARLLRSEGIVVYGVDVGGEDREPMTFGCAGLVNASAGVGQASFIAERTGGRVVSASANEVVAVLQDVAEAIPQSDRVDVRDGGCRGVLDLKYDPEFPVPVTGEEEISLQVEMSVTKAVCELGGRFRCQLEFVGMGVLLGLTKIEIEDVIGCT